MAGRTASGDAGVVHGGAGEAGRRFMAGLASSTGRYMIGWLG